MQHTVTAGQQGIMG